MKYSKGLTSFIVKLYIGYEVVIYEHTSERAREVAAMLSDSYGSPLVSVEVQHV